MDRRPASIEFFGIRIELGRDPVFFRVQFTEDFSKQLDRGVKLHKELLLCELIAATIALLCWWLAYMRGC